MIIADVSVTIYNSLREVMSMSGGKSNEIHADNRIDNWCYLWMAMFMAFGFLMMTVINHFLGTVVVKWFGVVIVVTLLVMLLYSKWKKSINERRVVYVILLISIVIRICYVIATSQEAYDTEAFAIFKDVHTNLTLPDTSQPLFYVAAAALYNSVGMWRFSQPYALDIVRLVNEYLGIVCTVAIYYILCELEANDTAVYICTALTAFLPGLIIVGGEISPTMLLMAMLTMTMLFLSRWNNYTDCYNFLLMSITFGLAVMTSNTALLFLPVIVTLILINLVRTIKHRNALNILTTGIQTAVGLVAWVVLSFVYPVRNYMAGKDTGLTTLLQELGSASGKVNLQERFLSFSLTELMDTYPSPARDRNAWAYLVKTSFFGSMKRNEGWLLDESVLRWAVLVGFAVAAAAGAMVICDLFSKIDAKKKVNIWAFAALLALMVGYYVLIGIARPTAETMSFLTLPVIAIPGLSLYAVGMKIMDMKKKLNFVAGILYFLMVTVSVVYLVACACYSMVFMV